MPLLVGLVTVSPTIVSDDLASSSFWAPKPIPRSPSLVGPGFRVSLIRCTVSLELATCRWPFPPRLSSELVDGGARDACAPTPPRSGVYGSTPTSVTRHGWQRPLPCQHRGAASRSGSDVPSGHGLNARTRRSLPRVHRRGWPVLADGLRQEPPGRPLPRGGGMDRPLAFSSWRPLVDRVGLPGARRGAAGVRTAALTLRRAATGGRVAHGLPAQSVAHRL